MIVKFTPPEYIGGPVFAAIAFAVLTAFLVITLTRNLNVTRRGWSAIGFLALAIIGVGFIANHMSYPDRIEEAFMHAVEKEGIESAHLEGNVLTGKGPDGEFLEGVVLIDSSGKWEIVLK